MDRRSVTQQVPATGLDLSGFPARPVRQGSQWRKAHKRENSPWFYDSTPEGRFNLSDPVGTCYLANTPETAAREVTGPEFLNQGFVNAEFAKARVVSTLEIPSVPNLANITEPKVFIFGISNELCTMSDYSVTRAWAAAFHTAGFGGIWYHSRYSTAAKSRSIGIFGAAGEHDGDLCTQQTLTEVLTDMRVPVVEVNRLSDYRVFDEPR